MPNDKNIPRYLSIVFGVLFLMAAIVVGGLEYAGLATGSIALPRVMAQQQSADKFTLVLPGDLKYWASYKLSYMADNPPEVVLVGSSRSGQIRSAMFRPYKFYNASFTAWSIKELTSMIDQITRVAKPRVIIIALDYFMFTDAYANYKRTIYYDNDLRYRYDGFFNLVKVLTDHPSMVSSYIYPRLLGREPAERDGLRLIGINAVQTKSGFRYDGSFLYPTGIIAAAARNTKDNKGLIGSVPGGARVDPQQMAELKKLVAIARERGAQLIGIQLPIAKASVDYLNSDRASNDHAGVWREFESKAMIDRLWDIGIPFFDLCCGEIIADSGNFIDAIHLGERGMLSILIGLFEDARFRSFFPAIEVEKLKRDLADAQKKGEFFHVYRNQF